MEVYCGCKKCGGTADKCFGDMYPGASFKPIKSPQTEQAEASSLSDLLAGVDDIISKIRHEEYRANSCYEATSQKYFDGSGDSYKHCAEMLTELIKKTS